MMDKHPVLNSTEDNDIFSGGSQASPDEIVRSNVTDVEATSEDVEVTESVEEIDQHNHHSE